MDAIINPGCCDFFVRPSLFPFDVQHISCLHDLCKRGASTAYDTALLYEKLMSRRPYAVTRVGRRRTVHVQRFMYVSLDIMNKLVHGNRVASPQCSEVDVDLIGILYHIQLTSLRTLY